MQLPSKHPRARTYIQVGRRKTDFKGADFKKNVNESMKIMQKCKIMQIITEI